MAAVLHQQAFVLHHLEPGGLRGGCGLCVFNAQLQPQRLRADGNGFGGNRRHVNGIAEHVHQLDFFVLGGLERHRAITGLTITGCVLNTDYTLDAASGKVTMLTDNANSPAITASYGYTDPPSVSMLTASTK